MSAYYIEKMPPTENKGVPHRSSQSNDRDFMKGLSQRDLWVWLLVNRVNPRRIPRRPLLFFKKCCRNIQPLGLRMTEF